MFTICKSVTYDIGNFIAEVTAKEESEEVWAFYVLCSHKITGESAYLTQLNSILSAAGLTGEETFTEDSIFYASENMAKKCFNDLTLFNKELWERSIIPEIIEDYNQGWD